MGVHGRQRLSVNGLCPKNTRPEKTMSNFSSDDHNDIRALSLHDLCQTVSVSRSFVYKEVSAGRLKKTKVGRKTLFLKTHVIEWLRNKEESR